MKKILFLFFPLGLFSQVNIWSETEFNLKYAKNITPVTHNIVMDGYFYSKLFISAEGHKLTVDYITKKASCDEKDLGFFKFSQKMIFIKTCPKHENGGRSKQGQVLGSLKAMFVGNNMIFKAIESLTPSI